MSGYGLLIIRVSIVNMLKQVAGRGDRHKLEGLLRSPGGIR